MKNRRNVRGKVAGVTGFEFYLPHYPELSLVRKSPEDAGFPAFPYLPLDLHLLNPDTLSSGLSLRGRAEPIMPAYLIFWFACAVSNVFFSTCVAASGRRSEEGVMPAFNAVITPTASQ